MNDEPENWSPEVALRIDAACCRFEERVKAGEAPLIEDYLAGLEGLERESLRAELLAVRSQWIARNATAAFSTTPPLDPALRTPAVSIPRRYQFECELGRGGMGVVYRARDTHLNRLVALKMILAGEQAGDRHLARFRTEAEAVAALSHPNVVQIFDTGEHEGNPYLVLEFVAGGTLASRLTQGELEPV